MPKLDSFLTLIILVLVCPMFAQSEEPQDKPSAAPSSLAIDNQQTDQLPSPNRVSADQRKEQVAASLFRELDNLIPGTFEDDSPQKLAIEKVVQYFQEGKATDATSLLDELAARDKTFPPKELLLAAVTYAVNDAARGRLLLESAAVKYRDYPGVFLAFARLAINENRISDARAIMEKVDRLVGKKAFSEREANHFRELYLDGMIDISIRQQQREEARELTQQLKQLNPENHKYLLATAELDFQDGKVESSLDFLNQLKANLPQTRTPELIIATWYQQQGDTENTQKWAKTAAEKYPSDPLVQVEFANYAVVQENFEAANVAIQKAEQELGELPGTVNLKARIAFAQSSYEVAEANYQKLFNLQPQNFDASNMYALSPCRKQRSRKTEPGTPDCPTQLSTTT